MTRPGQDNYKICAYYKVIYTITKKSTKEKKIMRTNPKMNALFQTRSRCFLQNPIQVRGNSHNFGSVLSCDCEKILPKFLGNHAIMIFSNGNRGSNQVDD